jgi:hypothetical protein
VHRFALQKKVNVMVMGAWVGSKSSVAHRAEAALLDERLRVSGHNDKRWKFLSVGCRCVGCLDSKHFNSVCAGQILKAHKSKFDSFFNNK